MKSAAGLLMVSKGFLLMQQRSANEYEPLTWGIFGGMLEPGETPEQAARREFREETQIDADDIVLKPVHTSEYPEEGFSYRTFIGELGRPQIVTCCSESNDAGWFQLCDDPLLIYQHLPMPLHSGMHALLAAPAVRSMLLAHVSRHRMLKEHVS